VEPTLEEALKKGIEAHKAGQVQEADRLSEPSTKSQDPPSEQLHSIINLFTQGQLQQALSDASQMLERFPNSAVLYNIAGASNAGLMQFDAAINSYKQSLKIKPDYAKAYNNMAIALNAKGDPEAAVECCKQALKIEPDNADAYNNMGIALNDKGDSEAAVASYKQALNIKPDDAEVYNNMGVALKDMGDPDASIDSYKQALKIKPNDAEVYNNMGVALKDKGDPEAAIISYKQALKIKPDYAEVYYNMGAALKGKGSLGSAIDSYKKALKIKPDYFEAYNGMGNALYAKGDLEAAIDSYKQAVNINPDHADAYYNRGHVLVEKGALDAGIKSYEMALKIKPDHQAARAGKLRQHSYMCDWAALEQDRHLIATLGTSTESIDPFGFLSFEDAPERHRVRSEAFTKKLYGYKTPLPPAVRPSQKPQRLRIGYFSADFYEHPVAYLMAKVLETHDRTRFEVYGYSIGPAKDDDMRQSLIRAFNVFVDVRDMNDEEVALLARQDKIDIAIDLNGYTENSRTGIFAYRAAPVQINYLGYPGTMGADFIDYIIADKTLIPMDSQKFYSEKPIYLPHHYQAQDNTLLISDDTPSRLDLGLPEKGFVFCAINNSYKITASEFDIWMRLLGHVDGSVLWLLESNKWVKGNLRKEAQLRGISADRLVFAQQLPHEKYLAQFRRADLYLDTFNYNAGATASNALWAGLPVLTKLGEGYTARMAGSLLPSIGLPELATHSEEDYENLALALATDLERLEKIRQTLADNRLSTPLFDTELFTKHLEDGYQQAYQRYYDGKLPGVIFVPEHC
jgi:predicted O-linked N-acetylglucosamine transferase (SPINDLY family)